MKNRPPKIACMETLKKTAISPETLYASVVRFNYLFAGNKFYML